MSSPDDALTSRVTRRLERERAARLAAEAIAEAGLRDLYERQKELTLLQVIAAAANEASAMLKRTGPSATRKLPHITLTSRK